MNATSPDDRAKALWLLEHGHQDDPDRFTGAWPGVQRAAPQGWLWAAGGVAHPATGFGLRDDRAYTHVAPAQALLHRPPAAALAGDQSSASRQEYQRCSVDITMKGGTTSGVVYPLAVCEIARRAVLRNVGGSSAGAIAAAAAAAAELGRSALVTDRTRLLAPARPGADQVAADGAVRPGFAGLADVAAWLMEADADASAPSQYRLGQLFGPSNLARPLFRVLVAVMRRRYSRVPLVLLGVLPPTALIALLLAWLAAPAVVAGHYPWGANGLRGYGLALGWLAAVTTLSLGVPVVALVLRSRRPTPPVLPEPVTARPLSTPPPARLALAAVTAGVLLPLALAPFGVPPLWRLIAVWFLVITGAVLVQVLWLTHLVNTASQNRFGIIAGARQPLPAGAPIERARSLLDVAAGLPPRTIRPYLLEWLDATLTSLAALPPEQVLRFGHLWDGPEFRSGAPDHPAAEDRQRRLVNLELMTTDVVHGRPLRFPLSVTDQFGDAGPGGPSSLLVRRSDLDSRAGLVLPRRVIDALCVDGTQVSARETATGTTLTDLYPLPLPWDLPVLFAVRLSLAFPLLFQSVRLYRRVLPRSVRDDFGTRLTRHGRGLQYPGGGDDWVEPLWIGDGGITSNFPIHFFDRLLPRWPTLGINLSEQPDGSAHERVWLSSDCERPSMATNRVGRGLAGYLAALLNTGLAWRDTAQTLMPAFRGRVATVRIGAGEGGNNLFMPRDAVAALVLRGALAGARLSKRYADDGQWHRHQWLRLRVAMDNVADLETAVRDSMASTAYDELRRDGGGFLLRVREDLRHSCDPNPPVSLPRPGDEPLGERDEPTPWYRPDPVFWNSLGPVLQGLIAPSLAGLGDGAPVPAPDLKQMPR